MNSTIILTPNALDTVYEQAIEIYPDECCGFLYGKEQCGRVIEQAIPVTNSKTGDKRRRFEISPLDYLRAEQYAEENNIQLLGIYHSHPNHPAIASIHDLEKALPYFSYVIVSVFETQIADIMSWRLRDEKRIFEKEKVLLPQYARN